MAVCSRYRSRHSRKAKRAVDVTPHVTYTHAYTNTQRALMCRGVCVLQTLVMYTVWRRGCVSSTGWSTEANRLMKLDAKT